MSASKPQPGQRKGRSPYKKYGKSPYAYGFKRCEHNHTVRQSMPTWSGLVCAACNTITKRFD